ncbi:hypothetical protein F0562_018814 [Nyssa sinensis]|uniref:Uncharacterized protein n=1 Tax=Nyssa sinensis TaxID=561372 RepID=A0A5J4ZAF3_9ASTE|nr:hypothetical protein F0562_018814 [Nyssa sinensis]
MCLYVDSVKEMPIFWSHDMADRTVFLEHVDRAANSRLILVLAISGSNKELHYLDSWIDISVDFCLKVWD